MAAFTTKRFRPGFRRSQDTAPVHRTAARFAGLKEGGLVPTGPRGFCFIGRWQEFLTLVGAEPARSTEPVSPRTAPSLSVRPVAEARWRPAFIVPPNRERLH